MAGQQYNPDVSDTAPLPRVAPAQPVPPRRPNHLLLGSALVVVAVVAGLVWSLIRRDSGVEGKAGPVTDDPLTSGEFRYTVAAGPDESADCAGNSYGDVAEWFGEHPCEQVARALYSTETDGARALVSVVLVTMAEAATAQQLKVITDTEGTGNVNDLVRDGSANLPGAPQVAGGEYQSTARGREVTIVESAFFDGHTDEDLLARIAEDALRLAEHLR
ncbi:hypothetical protein [Qaidamihabitans albus]|uniref:hypothetical protein n=1 Tax=Qaidamihabitans albus TaxID=2795733 RepID=UPI0027DD82D0|nr:hypothetical protein [Qaidamihabitans albus]